MTILGFHALEFVNLGGWLGLRLCFRVSKGVNTQNSDNFRVLRARFCKFGLLVRVEVMF